MTLNTSALNSGSTNAQVVTEPLDPDDVAGVPFIIPLNNIGLTLKAVIKHPQHADVELPITSINGGMFGYYYHRFTISSPDIVKTAQLVTDQLSTIDGVIEIYYNDYIAFSGVLNRVQPNPNPDASSSNLTFIANNIVTPRVTPYVRKLHQSPTVFFKRSTDVYGRDSLSFPYNPYIHKDDEILIDGNTLRIYDGTVDISPTSQVMTIRAYNRGV